MLKGHKKLCQISMIISTNATTFAAAVQHGLTRAPVITLGGKDAGKFAPNVNMSFECRKKDEFYVNINRDKTIKNETA